MNRSIRLLLTLLSTPAIVVGCDASPTDEAVADPRDVLEEKTTLNPDGFDACSDAELAALADYVECLEEDRAAICADDAASEHCEDDDPLSFAGATTACAAPTDTSEACLTALAPVPETPSNGTVSLNCGRTQIFANLARAAYKDNPTVRLDAGWNNVWTFVEGNTFGFVARMELNGEGLCAASFRGTDDADDVIADLLGAYVDDCGAAVECGKGFYDEYKKLEDDGMLDKVIDMVEGGECEIGLWITGHSMGGSIADIFAAHLYSYNPSRFKWGGSAGMEVQTFGQPRTLEEDRADYYQNLIKKTRWVRVGDPIPGLLDVEAFKGKTGTLKHFGTTRQIWELMGIIWDFGTKDQNWDGTGLNGLRHKMSEYDSTLEKCQ